MTTAIIHPKKFTDRSHREEARKIRDHHWKFMERVAAAGTLWVCWWNKNRHHDEENLPSDLVVCGLLDGSELTDWMRRHKDWWHVGKWDEKRYASAVRLTKIGRQALGEREKYDMEPVFWGLAEPGCQAIPAKRLRDSKKNCS